MEIFDDNDEIVDSDGEDNVDDSNDDDEAIKVIVPLHFNKKTGEAQELFAASSEEITCEGEGSGGLFEDDEAVGDAFMAVKPWIGAVKEPSEHPPVNPSPPDEDYKLHYVFGYRAEDSRNNVYYNADGSVVYMTACLGVILNQTDNTQQFFGGNQVANAAKQHAEDLDNHTNDITSIAVSLDRTLACSGQNGSTPTVFVWDACTGQKIKRFVLPKGSREVSAIGLSIDNEYVATVDNHNDHVARVYKVSTGKLIFEQKTGNNQVFDLAWTQKEGQCEFSTCGAKHYMVCRPLEGLLKGGIYGAKGKATSHACCAYDTNGVAYTGGANALIHCWKNRQLAKTYKVHGAGFIGAIKVFDGQVYSGGKDGNVIISNPNTGQAERIIEIGNLIRAIDFKDGMIVVGDKDGTISEINADDEINVIMHSHSQGETWGLDLTNDGRIVTTGDDNKVMVWSLEERTLLNQDRISDKSEASKAGKASSLSTLPASQCARAVAVNHNGNQNVAIGSNSGAITIRESLDNLGEILYEKKNSKEWIEVLVYSPCGTMLACGSHDNNIYIYNVDEDYKLKCTLKAHNSYITSVDWSEDSSTIKSVCGAYELLFFDVASGTQDQGGASATVDTVWATNTSKFGWCQDGIFPGNTDGTHVNHVWFSDDNTLVLTADDYGLVNVYRNPIRKGHQPKSYRAHSEHVVRVRFTAGAQQIISIGGYDKTIMIWNRQ